MRPPRARYVFLNKLIYGASKGVCEASGGGGGGWRLLVGAGHILVADNHRVQVLRHSDGAHVRTIGSQGSGNCQFNSLRNVSVDCYGRVVVCDCINHRLQVLA